MRSKERVAIIGGGLSGSECANILSRSGVGVDIYEMKPIRFSEAHKSELLAELVCSNSLKSNDIYNPQGLLKEEMRRFGSLIIEAADRNSIPAGQSLSVDRELFSRYITERLSRQKNIQIIRKEVLNPLDLLRIYPAIVVASGPLTSDFLAMNLKRMAGGDEFLYFYDAISPIVTADSIDMGKAFLGSRYNKGGDDYINCPLNKEEYRVFYDAIINAEYVKSHIDESLKFFEGCLPLEEIAKRGFDSLTFGPFKPVGFGFEKSDMPYAVVQLRAENREKTLYSMVAFQTRMKYGSQKKVIKLIPALKKCEIVRYE
ncbi:MAG: methylenetetrahydrofolate--tRNA-(uracil(54)-C(5))-methyltransferase (FADH(2)-oxidizing) TrmFO, partial [Myxococcota bacterium]